MKRTAIVTVALSILFGARMASATVITFDDAYAALGRPADPATFYSSLGLTFSGAYFGLVDGAADPGNWGLDGTNGRVFLGSNNGPFSSPTFNFATPVDSFSVDAGVSFGSAATLTASGFLNNVLVDEDYIAITDLYTRTGTWGTLSLSGTMDKIVISAKGADAFGLDNAILDGDSAPEPSTLLTLAGGLGLVIAACYRKRRAGNPMAVHAPGGN